MRGVTDLESCKFIRMAWDRYKFNINVFAHVFDRIARHKEESQAVRIGIEMKAIDCFLKASAAENLLRYGLQTVLRASANVRHDVLIWNNLLLQQYQRFGLISGRQ